VLPLAVQGDEVAAPPPLPDLTPVAHKGLEAFARELAVMTVR
jgi:hypothetical protein